MVKVPINILVVDDEKDFVEMLSLRLKDDGHNLWAAYSGEQALSALKTEPIDVVILDIKMPGMDGISALKEIKNRNPVVEVILLTGHGAIDTAVTGLKSGAFDYLLKPADYQELLSKLEAARNRKMEQEERIRKAEAKSLTRKTGGL
ncbi:response regulator [Dethiosulfatarculus sandiegensis]|uniref:Chemotaxis protein CheY n=1 Tax=Dethiosulfatarculus sandiegensis TaxID=1429043 RepID=A0A0D2JCC4_9BACT|nr:response regulator [Dethiosulfatarculus sandiegensis]KIX15794.1 chemotaxis protein CheY [Dethiosulfatarculus sandiegensis]